MLGPFPFAEKEKRESNQETVQDPIRVISKNDLRTWLFLTNKVNKISMASSFGFVNRNAFTIWLIVSVLGYVYVYVFEVVQSTRICICIWSYTKYENMPMDWKLMASRGWRSDFPSPPKPPPPTPPKFFRTPPKLCKKLRKNMYFL